MLNGVWFLTMQSLEAAVEEADNLLYRAKKHVVNSSFEFTSNGKQPTFSLFTKLAELEKEERLYKLDSYVTKVRQTNCILSSPHLIEKLVAQERLNTLLISLYAESEGYSIAIRNRNPETGDSSISDTMKFPYSEETLLDYLDSEQIPPTLSDILERVFPYIYYSGCVIAEVKDYRRIKSINCTPIHHVLLKPSAQTIINDTNVISSDKNCKWTRDDKLALESALIFVNTGPLCLIPKPSISIAFQKLNESKNALNNLKLKSLAKKRTFQGLERKKNTVTYAKCPPSIICLHKHIKMKRKRKISEDRSKNLIRRMPIPVSNHFWSNTSDMVIAQAKLLSRNFNETPTATMQSDLKLVEQYTMFSKEDRIPVTVTLSIYQRNCDGEHIGELIYNNEVPAEPVHIMSSCRFALGSQTFARKYVLQYIDMLTNHGKNDIKITASIPGYQKETILASGLRYIGNKVVAANRSISTAECCSVKALSIDSIQEYDSNAEYIAELLSAQSDVNTHVNSEPDITNDVLQTSPVTANDTHSIDNQIQLHIQRQIQQQLLQQQIIQKQQIQLQLQQQLQQQQQQLQQEEQERQQLTQQQRLSESPHLQNERQAIIKLKAQIQEHLQMQHQANATVAGSNKPSDNSRSNHNSTINGMLPQFASLLKRNINGSPISQVSPISPVVSTIVTKNDSNDPYQIATSMPQLNNVMMSQTSGNQLPVGIISQGSGSQTQLIANNPSILNLLSNSSSAQSASTSSTANITLNNLLTTVNTVRNESSNQAAALNISGQRVYAKRVKLHTTSQPSLQHVLSNSIANISNETAITDPITPAITSQPFVRVTIGSVNPNFNTQQKMSKSGPSRIIATSSANRKSSINALINSLQSNNVSNNNIHISSFPTGTVQAMTSGGSVRTISPASNIRIRTSDRKNITPATLNNIVNISSSNVNIANNVNIPPSNINATMNSDQVQMLNCTKIQTVSPGTMQQLNTGEIQTIVGTLTAAPTISRAVQLPRNVPGNVQVVTNATRTLASMNKEFNNVHKNSNGDCLPNKSQRIIRLSNNSQPVQSNMSRPALTAIFSDSSLVDNASSTGSLIDKVTNSQLIASQTPHQQQQQLPTIVNIANLTNVASSLQNIQNAGNISSLPSSIGTPVILTTSSRGERLSGKMKTTSLRSIASVTNANNSIQLVNTGHKGKLLTQLPNQGVRSLLSNITVPPNAVVQPKSNIHNQILPVAAAQQQLQLVLQKQAAHQLQLCETSMANNTAEITPETLNNPLIVSPFIIQQQTKQSSTGCGEI